MEHLKCKLPTMGKGLFSIVSNTVAAHQVIAEG